MKMLSTFCLEICTLNGILTLVKFSENRSLVANVGTGFNSQKQVLALVKEVHERDWIQEFSSRVCVCVRGGGGGG